MPKAVATMPAGLPPEPGLPRAPVSCERRTKSARRKPSFPPPPTMPCSVHQPVPPPSPLLPSDQQFPTALPPKPPKLTTTVHTTPTPTPNTLGTSHVPQGDNGTSQLRPRLRPRPAGSSPRGRPVLSPALPATHTSDLGSPGGTPGFSTCCPCSPARLRPRLLSQLLLPASRGLGVGKAHRGEPREGWGEA